MLVAVDAMDFNFNSTCSTPYASAPSSPKRFGDYYFSAPTSPSHSSSIYDDFNSFSSISDHNRLVGGGGFGLPKSIDGEEEDDFAFDFDGKLERSSLSSADELFDGGKIKPLSIPTSRLELNSSRNQRSPISSPKSPVNRQGKKIHPFKQNTHGGETDQIRGRGRTTHVSSSSSRSNRRESRSLSPLRVAEFALEEAQQQSAKDSKPTTSSSSSLKGSRRWSFRDFLLFRSASEGRASEKDPLRKYTAMPRRNEDEKNSSFRSTENQTAGSSSRRKGPVSAHEVHYKVNRAVAEESKRKTYLPYKPRLLGFLGFHPSVHSQRH